MLEVGDNNLIDDLDEEVEELRPSEHSIAMQNPAWRALMESITFLMASGKENYLVGRINSIGKLPHLSSYFALVMFLVGWFLVTNNKQLGDPKLEELLASSNIASVLNQYVTKDEIINQLGILLTMSDEQLKGIYDSSIYNLTLQLNLAREGVDENQELRLAFIDFRTLSDGSIERTIRQGVWSVAGINRPTTIEIDSVELLRVISNLLNQYGQETQDGPGSRIRIIPIFKRLITNSEYFPAHSPLIQSLEMLGTRYGFFVGGSLTYITRYVPILENGIQNNLFEIGYRDAQGDSKFSIEFNLDQISGDIVSFQITKVVNNQTAYYVYYSEPELQESEWNNIEVNDLVNLVKLISDFKFGEPQTYG